MTCNKICILKELQNFSNLYARKRRISTEFLNKLNSDFIALTACTYIYNAIAIKNTSPTFE